MSLECVVSVGQRQKITANGLSELSKKFDMPGNLFWKQPLSGVVKNGVLKIYAQSFENKINLF